MHNLKYHSAHAEIDFASPEISFDAGEAWPPNIGCH